MNRLTVLSLLICTLSYSSLNTTPPASRPDTPAEEPTRDNILSMAASVITRTSRRRPTRDYSDDLRKIVTQLDKLNIFSEEGIAQRRAQREKEFAELQRKIQREEDERQNRELLEKQQLDELIRNSKDRSPNNR